jgi:hydrogenase expression/formation protein HypC
MCLAIPTLIKSIDGQKAQVEIGGVERTISLALTPEAQVGDYVIVHTGFALNVLDEQEAQETLEIFREMEALAAAEDGNR